MEPVLRKGFVLRRGDKGQGAPPGQLLQKRCRLPAETQDPEASGRLTVLYIQQDVQKRPADRCPCQIPGLNQIRELRE